MKDSDLNFEQAFKRLEDILLQMNSSQLSLDKSLAYYEEADTLIQKCQHLLKSAEKKVEILVKNRSQELALDKEGKPQVQPFSPSGKEVEAT